MKFDRTGLAIKYCGGCNPHYDRKKAVHELETVLGGPPLPVAQPGKAYEMIFVINGCPASCADLSELSAGQFVMIDSLAELQNVKERLIQLME